MPRFDFQCSGCGHVFESTVSFGSRRAPRCPACGGKTEKLIAPPAIHFRGGGFYVTDSRKKTPEKETTQAKDTKKPTTNTPKEAPSKGETGTTQKS